MPDNFSTADTEFIMFLQNRYKKSKEEKKLEEEDKLINTLCQNFTNNENLLSKDLPKCAFAAAVQSLFFHQVVADTKTYPSNYLLAPFEQKYLFPLQPISFQNFVISKNSIPALQLNHYKQTVLRNFTKFLLITLARR